MSVNLITNPKTAKAVLITAKENAVWEAAIPSDEEKLLKDANFVYDQAVTAFNNGMRGNAVTAVKFSAEVDGKPVLPAVDDVIDADEPEALDTSKHTIADLKIEIDKLVQNNELVEVENIRAAEEKGKARKGVLNYIDLQLKDAYKEPDDTGEIESGDRGKSQGSGSVSPWAYPTDEDVDKKVARVDELNKKSKFNELFEAEEFARAQAKKLNLPVPERVDDIPSATLSRGVANLTVQELAERLTDSSLCLAAATWQTALAEIDEEHAERVGNHYFNIEYQKAVPNAKNVQAAQTKAEEVEEVKRWRDAQAEAHSRYLSFRALKEVYKGTYDTISRVFAMKQEANERHR
jgi:hypothetical protein